MKYSIIEQITHSVT